MKAVRLNLVQMNVQVMEDARKDYVNVKVDGQGKTAQSDLVKMDVQVTDYVIQIPINVNVIMTLLALTAVLNVV